MFDVGIVGGGPGGAWTACLLAQRGRRVAIFDPSHPREKPCGGGLTARALDLLGGALSRQDYPCVPIASARFLDSRHGLDCAVSLPTDAAALVVAPRAQFDGCLLRAAREAGATIVADRVTGVARAGERFHLATAGGTYECEHVVGADGANSLVRRTLAAALPRRHLSIATGFYVFGATSNDIVLELVSDPPGYLWSFPRPDHLAVGICAQADAGVTAGALRARAAEWIRTTGFDGGARLTPYSWPIPSLSATALRTAPLAGPGWLLVGDAAGLVDPITREGIFYALQSATFAADALAPAPADSRTNGSTHAQYAAAVRAHIMPELTRAAELKAGFFQPRFVRLLTEALRHSARVRRVMAEVIAGTQPYRGLERRLLATLEIGLAWKVLSARWRRSPRGHALEPLAD